MSFFGSVSSFPLMQITLIKRTLREVVLLPMLVSNIGFLVGFH